MTIILALVFIYLFVWCGTTAFLEWRDAISFEDHLIACGYVVCSAGAMIMALNMGRCEMYTRPTRRLTAILSYGIMLVVIFTVVYIGG
jgi:hypothetical protein